MRNIYLLSLLFCLVLPALSFSQEPCGTFEESKWLNHYLDHKHQYAEADTPWLYVPATMQVLGTNQGVGYYPKSQIFETLCTLNEQYEPLNIKFYLHPTDPFIYIDNSAWYEHNWDNGSDMIQANYYPDRLNCFIVADPAGNCGYSWQDVIVMKKNCSGRGNSTWAHEAGHHFSLPHTFLGWEGRSWDWTTPAPEQWGNRKVEKADGSNCAQAGDRFCDTDADYISDRWSCNSNGRSIPMLDPDSMEVRADGTLFMSYSNDDCQNRFSNEQIAAIRANLQDEHSIYLVTSTEGPAIANPVSLNSPADSTIIPQTGQVLSWDAVPNADYYEVQVSLFEHMDFALLVSTIVEGTSHKINVNLPLNRDLYWRVRPYSRWSFCKDLGLESEVRSFQAQNMIATNELEQKAVAQVAPNPVLSGQLMRLDVNSSEAFDAQLLVFDVNGRQVSNQPVRIYEGENSVSLETEGYASGTYRAVLQNEKGSIQKVFAVIR